MNATNPQHPDSVEFSLLQRARACALEILGTAVSFTRERARACNWIGQSRAPAAFTSAMNDLRERALVLLDEQRGAVSFARSRCKQLRQEAAQRSVPEAAADVAWASEARTILRSLPFEQRAELVNQHLLNGDLRWASAIVHSPENLVGAVTLERCQRALDKGLSADLAQRIDALERMARETDSVLTRVSQIAGSPRRLASLREGDIDFDINATSPALEAALRGGEESRRERQRTLEQQVAQYRAPVDDAVAFIPAELTGPGMQPDVEGAAIVARAAAIAREETDPEKARKVFRREILAAFGEREPVH